MVNIIYKILPCCAFYAFLVFAITSWLKQALSDECKIPTMSFLILFLCSLSGAIIWLWGFRDQTPWVVVLAGLGTLAFTQLGDDFIRLLNMAIKARR